MLNRKNKKGFTLAELLIVVAIIAVLVAIAVPLFVGALDDAKEDVFNANMRSVRSLAVKQIMTDDAAWKKGKDTDKGTKTWYVKAKIDIQGNIEITSFEDSGNQTEYEDYKPATKDSPAELTVVIEESEVTVTAAAIPGA